MQDQRTYDPQKYGPLLIKTIIGVNIIMFISSLLISVKNIHFGINPLFFLSPSFKTLTSLGGAGIHGQATVEFWKTLILSNWLHGSFLHLLFNMMAIRTVAPLVIKEFGMSRMFTIYTLSGMAGFCLSYMGQVYLTIGASCSLCGLIGASLYFGKSRGGIWGQLVFKQTSAWILSLIIFGFLLPGINNWGHAGGLLSGIFLGWVFGYLETRKEYFLDRVIAAFFSLLTLFLIGSTLIFLIRWVYT